MQSCLIIRGIIHTASKFFNFFQGLKSNQASGAIGGKTNAKMLRNRNFSVQQATINFLSADEITFSI